MKSTQLVWHLARKGMTCAVIACCVAGLAAPIAAATIEIQFTGMKLSYDGSSIYDTASAAGGFANPADATPLAEAEFFVDGNLVGSINSDVSLDVFIPDVSGIPAAANTVDNQTTPGNPGYFDLLIGTSPLASQFLLVDLTEVNITYIDVQNIVQFTFGAALADLFTQNLPFGLQIGDPVTVSFSAQVIPGTKTNNGSVITGFDVNGTGEIRGTLVPEPASCLLAAFGLIGCLTVRRR